MKHRPELVAFALAAVVVAAAAALLLAGDPVPSWFPILALAAVTGGAGLAIPGATAGEATSSGDPTTTTDDNGWTLNDLSSWIDTELVPKIEKAFARAHVHAAPANGGGVEAPPPSVPAAPAPTADAQGTTQAALPPPPTNVAQNVPQSAPAGPTAPAAPGSVL